MAVKRMRVFAGPNGSGKTTIFKGILNEKKVQLGVYVNADEIELALSNKGSIDFSQYKLNTTNTELQYFFKHSNFSPVKRNEPDLWSKLNVENNKLNTTVKIDSYLAADLAEFIRQQLLKIGVSFTYEIVMSHSGKINFLNEAIEKGFRVYLYYIATEDPEINISRVNVRVAQQGHYVPAEIVRNRYYKSLQNLRMAVKYTNRAYIFDNSQKSVQIIAEITDGSDVTINRSASLPNWVAEYLLNDTI